MSWIKNKNIKTIVDHASEQWKKEDDHAKLYLEHAREVAGVWIAILEHPVKFKSNEYWLTDFEEIIKECVKRSWGNCVCKIDRALRSFMVLADDGRQMDLISGKVEFN